MTASPGSGVHRRTEPHGTSPWDSLHPEHDYAVDEITGRIPAGLRGTLYRTGTAHRYTYLAEASVPGGDPDSIATVDHATATTRRFVGDTGNSVCEPLFAPASDTEGDGWLLTVEHCAAERRSRVLILPAARPDTGPAAPIGLRHHVPMTFHGTFVPRWRAPGNRPVLQRICPAASSGRVRETPPRVAAAWWHVAGRPHRRGRTCRSSFAEDHLQQFGSSTTRSASRASLRALW
ncbi:carotenoid oxygenase family protein [Rhodococcus zopfii]|uniref:carotenoid oxygenase family protein n=1 Tax=Rhodococcus zopfii TaxID=43772 RepID=UPI0035279E72